MNDIQDFISFCIESYSITKHLTEQQTVELFSKYGVLDYLKTCCDVLHTTGRAFIIEDIDAFIDVRKSCSK